MNRKSTRTLLVLSAIAMAMIVSPAVVSYPTGIQGVKDSGCNCHGATTSSEVVPVSYTHLTLPTICSV